MTGPLSSSAPASATPPKWTSESTPSTCSLVGLITAGPEWASASPASRGQLRLDPSRTSLDGLQVSHYGESARRSRRDASVLVVDDDPAIRSTVAEILRLEGYPVETAENGAEALHLIHVERPAMVILDMRMPVLDGWGFARELREQGIDVPILVMTAAQNARRWAEEIGAASYVPKPFELVDLLDAVERLIGPPPP